MLLNIFSIFIGGGSGAVLRYLTSLFYNKSFPSTIPVATLLINFIGCFIFGVFAAIIYHNSNMPEQVKCALTVGLCGGFTTFSTFAFEVVEMLRRGELVIAVLYVILTVILSIFFTAVGFYWTKNYVGF
jgi:CrcB protein